MKYLKFNIRLKILNFELSAYELNLIRVTEVKYHKITSETKLIIFSLILLNTVVIKLT